MKLFNLFKKRTNSNVVAPIEDKKEEQNILDNNIIDKEKYYELKLRIYSQLVNIDNNTYRIKSALDDCFTKLINTCSDNRYFIKDKDELIKILNIFYEKNTDLNNTKDTVMNYITNEFNFQILTIDELKEKKQNENKLKKLRNIIFNNYKAIKSNKINEDFAWMVFCFKNKLTKNELLNNLEISLKENNISESDINDEINNLNIILSFGNIPTEEEVLAYRNSIGNTTLESIEDAIKFFKGKIESNNNEIYINLYSTFYWSRYSNKTNKTKEEILSYIKNNKLYELIKNSLNNFNDICNEEKLKKAQEDLERYVEILELKKYINNWKEIKTNQINDSDIEDKNRYFKELEEDYLNLSNSLNDKLEIINNILNTINNRDYITKLNINSTKIMKELNLNTQDINSIENELKSIKRWQETISNLRKY